MSELAFGAVAIDIDGTLLSSEHRVLPSSIEWITRARAAGAHVMISSGRPLSGIRGQLDRAGLTVPLALSGYNGAIARTSDGEQFVDRRVEADLAREVLRFAAQFPVSRMACVDDLLLFEDADGLGVRAEMEGNLMTPERMDTLEDLADAVHKVLFVAPAEQLAIANEALRVEFGDRLAITTSAPIYCEVSTPQATKGESLVAYCERYGVPIEKSLVFGDAENDLPMLRTAGLGVAMGNAAPAIQAAADRVTATNDEDGIALVLQEFFG